MRVAPGCRTSGRLFADAFLADRLPELDAWSDCSASDLRAARAAVRDALADESDSTPDCPAVDHRSVVQSVFRALDVPVAPGGASPDGRQLVDYAVFPSNEAARDAADGRDALDVVPETAVAVADVRPPGRSFDACGTLDDPRAAETPTYRVHVALQETPARWAVLTDGETWRLYDERTSHRLDSFYEVHLPTLLERGGLPAFRYFYCFFRGAAFADGERSCFLERVVDANDAYVHQLAADVRENAHEAVRVLAAGFLDALDGDPDGDDLRLVRDASVVYLYRLLVAAYAASRGWSLSDSNEAETADASALGLDALGRSVAARLDDGPGYDEDETGLWSRLASTFERLDGTGSAVGPAQSTYDGWLFRTDPDEHDERAVRFLATHEVDDRRLARAVDLVSRRRPGDGPPEFVDYSSLSVRKLGRIYEGLLERDLAITSEPLARVDGRYVPAAPDDEVAVTPGEPYLTTDSGERTDTGSYYTPADVVEYIVENALDPLVGSVATAVDDESDAEPVTPASVLAVTVLDPATGSGHFLTNAVDYLVRAVVDAQEQTARQQGIDAVPPEHDVAWVRRQVADRCVYGVDLDPVAVELTRASLWLRASTPGRPPATPGTHLQAGNSLVGLAADADDEIVAADADDGRVAADADDGRAAADAGDGRVATDADDERVATDAGETAAAPAAPAATGRDTRHRRLRAVANVLTAERFGLETPAGADDRLRAAVTDDEAWTTLAETDWFREAQRRAAADRYFHWPLAFPDVFRPGGEGFDAVVGNPPWAITTDEATKRYLRRTYDLQSGQPDLYRFFVERCLSLASQAVGMITPNTWFTMDAAKPLRRHVLTNGYLDRASLVPLAAFDAVGANMVTFRLDLADPQDQVDVWVLDDSGAATHCRYLDYADLQTPPYTVDLRAKRGERSVAASLECETVPLGDVAQFTTGYQLYHTSIHDRAVIEAERYHADRPETDVHVPEIRGASVSRFHVDPEPDGYVDVSAEFYRVPDARFRQGAKVLVREVPAADGVVAAHTDRDLLFPKSVISVVPGDGYDAAALSGLLNSDAVSFYVRVTGEKSAQKLFPRVSLSTLRRLPTPAGSKPVSTETVDAVLDDCAVDDEFRGALSADATAAADARDLVGRLAERIAATKRERAGISTSLFDYVDPDEATRPLGDHPAYRRAPGVADSMLGRTADTRPKLKLASLVVDRTPEGLALEAAVRYKPDRPAEHDTDRWGYARDGPMAAATLVGVEGVERELLASFVERVVNEADDGVAGFRPDATKTNSLCDRLEALRVPELSSVRAAFERYQDRSRRAAVLDARVECAVTLLNELVYDLYELSEMDRAVVREAFDDT